MNLSSIPDLLSVQVPMGPVIRELNEETRGVFEKMCSALEKYMGGNNQSDTLRIVILDGADRMQSYIDCIRHIMTIKDKESPTPDRNAEKITVGYGQRE